MGLSPAGVVSSLVLVACGDFIAAGAVYGGTVATSFISETVARATFKQEQARQQELARIRREAPFTYVMPGEGGQRYIISGRGLGS
jgi:hypothetical protein